MERPEVKDFSLLEILGFVFGGFIILLWPIIIAAAVIAFIAGLL
jgi:hypothetical protein